MRSENVEMNCDIGSSGSTLANSSFSCAHPSWYCSLTTCTHTESTLSLERMRMSVTAILESFFMAKESTVISLTTSSGCCAVSSRESARTMKLNPTL